MSRHHPMYAICLTAIFWSATSSQSAGVHSTTQCWKDGKVAPCGPGNDQCGPPQDENLRPKFHIKDLTCDENDPNFPFFDEVHGMYHLMYQDHLAIAPGHGPDIGHVVSRDFVHWAHLPVSIWNDKPYDEEAIFTGSATIVDGKPFIVYPGLCKKGGDFAGCITGMNYAQAVPADPSDPFYTNWTKDAAPGINIAKNPIVNGTSDDPSTAWKTAYGEWRLIGNAKAAGQKKDNVAPIFAASDFTGEWKLVGDTTFPSGECPSFFPLPALYPGTTTNASDALPSHVHKRGHGSPGCNGDCMTLGTWVDGAPGEVGTWSATPGVPFDEVLIDHGSYYASKDFYDKPNGRRINWGWATIPGGSQSMARVITYHPVLKQLVYSPAAEYNKLHAATPLSQIGSTSLQANKPMSLGKWAEGAGNSSDVLLTFKRPTKASVFGLSVLSGAMTVGIQLDPNQVVDGVAKVKVSMAQGPPSAYDTKNNGPTDVLQLLDSDTEITLRVFTDRTLVEAYWMDGRVAMTSAISSSKALGGMDQMEVFSSVDGVEIASAIAWEMNSIWVSKEEVLASPRLDIREEVIV